MAKYEQWREGVFARGADRSKGFIALGSPLAGMLFRNIRIMEFKKIEITELPPTWKDDKERLQGRWVAESVDNGRVLPKELAEQFNLTFTGGKMQTTMLGAAISHVFHLDQTVQPKKIDIISEDDRKGRFGIYRFDGDRLVLCIGEDDEKDRPTEFSSKGRRMVVVFKRIEEPPPAWVPLFNGKDLTGWKNHPDQPGDWKVENKMLVGHGRMALLYSERRDYGDYDLRIEAKVSKGGYGGVYIRTPEFPPIRKQVFEDPKGHRIVLSADSKHEPMFNTGSLKTWRPKSYMVQACTTPTPPDEWFTLDISRGPEVFVRVNGKQTAQIGKTAEQCTMWA